MKNNMGIVCGNILQVTRINTCKVTTIYRNRPVVRTDESRHMYLSRVRDMFDGKVSFN